MKIYIIFLILASTTATYATFFNLHSNNGFTRGHPERHNRPNGFTREYPQRYNRHNDAIRRFPGRYNRHNELTDGLNAPSRILEVQEISTVHGRPYGQPVLLKVFYRNKNNRHANNIPNFSSNPDGNHQVFTIIHEGQQPQQLHDNNQKPFKVINVIHENLNNEFSRHHSSRHENGLDNENISTGISKILPNQNNIHDGDTILPNTNYYAGDFTSGWAKV